MNGYENNETFYVAVWVDNEYEIYSDVLHYSREHDVYETADHIENVIEDNRPCIEPSVYLDLMENALSNVNYIEIAKAFKEEYE